MSNVLRQFPLASKSFSVFRRNQTTVDVLTGNIIPVAVTSTVPISTQESILLRDLEDSVVADEHGAGYIATSRFLGLTFFDTIIIIGDVLADNGENDRFGNAVRYAVDGKSITSMATKLHLNRLDVSV